MNINFGDSVVFDPVAGATSYDFSLRGAAGSPELVVVNKATPVCPAEDLLTGRADGNYTCACRGKQTGYDGPYSALLALEFVRLTAPLNGRVE